jgi:hypothetical protein
MTTSALGPGRRGWQRPVAVIADVAELRGPMTGWCGCRCACMRPAEGLLDGSTWATRPNASNSMRSC